MTHDVAWNLYVGKQPVDEFMDYLEDGEDLYSYVYAYVDGLPGSMGMGTPHSEFFEEQGIDVETVADLLVEHIEAHQAWHGAMAR